MMKNEDCENDALFYRSSAKNYVFSFKKAALCFQSCFLLFVLFLILQDFGKRKQFRHL